MHQTQSNLCTLQPKIVAVADVWSLLGGHLCNTSSKWNITMFFVVHVVNRWSLFEGGRLLRFNCT